MRIKFKTQWLKELLKRGGTKITDFSYMDDSRTAELDIERFTDTDLDFILEKCASDPIPGGIATKQKIGIYRKLLADPTSVRISKLEVLKEALIKYIKPSKHRWVFNEKEDGMFVPWYVEHIEYHKPDPRSGTNAYTEMRLCATQRGENVSTVVRYEISELGGSVAEIMQREGYVLETAELVADYNQHMARHNAVYTLTGKQFLCNGAALSMDRWSHGPVQMVRDGEPSKVVMDDLDTEDGESRNGHGHRREVVATAKFWCINRKAHEDDDESDDEGVILPIHPYVKVFELKRHRFVLSHVLNLEEYVYDDKLIDKLILPQNEKELVHLLITSADFQMEDIIKGKTGGIFVIALGPPGTGKTLTAEVFSENVKRALYMVQCSQLGTDEAKLEENLQTVLARSSRWGAILLVDEADVYVHARGEDIQQNAIVGVWLRMLEYYRGILFMTTNRDVTIDDAVLSRATARIRYRYPEQKLLRQIWRVLADQYKVALTDPHLERLLNNKHWKTLAGRSVKNLLKLATYRSHAAKRNVTVEDIEYVSQFVELTSTELGSAGVEKA